MTILKDCHECDLTDLLDSVCRVVNCVKISRLLAKDWRLNLLDFIDVLYHLAPIPVVDNLIKHKLGVENDLLSIAATRGGTEMIKLLQKYNFDFVKEVEKLVHDGKSVYLMMCKNGHLQCLQLLNDILTQKNYVNGDKTWLEASKFDTDENGSNALHLVSCSENVAMLKYLLDNVYFPNDNLNDQDGLQVISQENKFGKAPLTFVCKFRSYKSVSMFKLLIEYNKNGTTDMWFPLYTAAFYNNMFILKFILHEKLGVDIINSSGNDPKYDATPLMGAITQHNIEAVEILCKFSNVDIDKIGNKYQRNCTALDYGAYFGNGEILKILIRTLLKQSNVKDLKSFQQCLTLDMLDNLKSLSQVQSDKNQSLDLIRFLIENYEKYYTMAMYIRYNVMNTMKQYRSKIPNRTVTTDAYEYGDEDSKSETRNNSSTNTVDRWTIHEVLGRGGFGRVMRGTDRKQNNKEVALKFISINKMVKSGNVNKRLRLIELIINEIDTIHKLNHENAIKLLAYNLNVDDSGTVLLVFEYAQYGELYQFLAISKYFNSDIAKTYFEQILNALEVCHTMGIIHRDIKPQNILLDSQYQIKIADFGLSTYDTDITNKNTLFVGTRGYMSPEIAAPVVCDYDDETDEPIYRDVTPSCDIFSLAVILWQMLNGVESMPFDESTKDDPKYVYIAENELKMFWKCHYNCNIVKESNSSSIQDLLVKMLAFNPDQRIGISRIRTHEWYTNTAGYNTDGDSAIFFFQLMQSVHKQLINQQRKTTNDAATTQIQTMNSYDKQDYQQTYFKFSQIKYVLYIHV